MSLYNLAKLFLFRFSGENAHSIAFALLNLSKKLNILKWFIKKPKNIPITIANITFPNPVGLAAGLDKNGDYIDALADLGFGFIEIGTITPRPQPGNPKPRLFRLKEYNAIINRMGFNNKGVNYLVEKVKQSNFDGILGINIGKNFDTEVENAVNDYLICLEKVYQYASYITVNISSPNTPGLRNLQYGDTLRDLLIPLKEKQTELTKTFDYKPIFVKIAPDMNEEEIETVATTLIECNMDGVIATNTTLERNMICESKFADEAGGLSGKPVETLSTQTIKLLSNKLKGKLPIIGVGGIHNGESAVNKIKAGASLVQIYTGFIYEGPELISNCVEAISKETI